MAVRKTTRPWGFNNDIFLLPKETSRVVFQYSPSINITAIIGSSTKKIAIAQKGGTERLELKVPDLAFVQTLFMKQSGHTEECECPNCVTNPKYVSDYYAYNIQVSKDASLLLKPFNFGNISESGQVCWGKQRFSNNLTPDNLRQAHSVYWGASFNMDLWGPYKDHQSGGCTNVGHYCSARSCVIKHRCTTFEVAGQCKVLHACHRRNSLNNFVNSNGWGPVPNPCDPGCTCCGNNCSCAVTSCRCCYSGCNCSTNCECCNGECSCRCKCNLEKGFIDFLKGYDPAALKAPWKSGNALICGDKFVTSLEHADAVFVSSNPEIMEAVDKNKHHFLSTGEPFIIGFATRSLSGWDVKIDEEVLSIGEEFVNICAANGRAKYKSVQEKIEKEKKAEPKPITPLDYFDFDLEELGNTLDQLAGKQSNKHYAFQPINPLTMMDDSPTVLPF